MLQALVFGQVLPSTAECPSEEDEGITEALTLLLQGHGIGEAIPGSIEELQQEEEEADQFPSTLCFFLYYIHSSLFIFYFHPFVMGPLQQLPGPLVGPTHLLVSFLSLFFIFHPSLVGPTTTASCPYP